jgi:hypothetical protein
MLMKVGKMRKAKLLIVSLLVISISLLTQQAGVVVAVKADSSNRGVSHAHALASPPAQRGGSSAQTGGLAFAPRRIFERNRRLKYTIKANYPQIIGAKNGNAAQFNRAVRELMDGEVRDFKKDFAPPDPSTPKEIQESTFDAAYSIEHNGPDLISVSFGVSVYNAGAAHPNHYSLVLNYDLNAGRTLKLSDLFNPGSNYMHAISDFTIKALKKKFAPDADAEWIERGAAPDSENYKSWNITRRGLVVTFDPYQVASYAEGEHVVVIPYTALRSVINMDGPLAQLAKQSPARKLRN